MPTPYAEPSSILTQSLGTQIAPIQSSVILTPSVTASNTIRLGSTGESVKQWQRIIGVTDDGNFGPATVNATRVWQSKHNITADGIVGPITWNKALNPVTTPIPSVTTPIPSVATPIPSVATPIPSVATLAVATSITPVVEQLGTKTNPIKVAGNLWVSADKQGLWGTRTVNGVQEFGRFITPRTYNLGSNTVTQYRYVKEDLNPPIVSTTPINITTPYDVTAQQNNEQVAQNYINRNNQPAEASVVNTESYYYPPIPQSVTSPVNTSISNLSKEMIVAPTTNAAIQPVSAITNLVTTLKQNPKYVYMGLGVTGLLLMFYFMNKGNK
jgi:peptidoglycan hydrolase-like protein with peptidoglycan-binding domain